MHLLYIPTMTYSKIRYTQRTSNGEKHTCQFVDILLYSTGRVCVIHSGTICYLAGLCVLSITFDNP